MAWSIVTDSGAEYVARPVKSADIEAFSRSCRDGSAEEMGRGLRALLRKAFPWVVSMRWHGDPVDQFFRQPELIPERTKQLMLSALPNAGAKHG